MTVKHVKKYLAPSPATPKGRMKRPRAGFRSTTKKKEQHEKVREEPVIEDKPAREINFNIPTQGHVIPDASDNNLVINVFCFAALADKNKGTLYTDATSTLPVRSINNNQCYYVVYDYDTNYVHTVPVEDLTDATIIKTFDKIFRYMERKGHKPCLNITDNQAVAPLKRYLAQKNCKWQFVELSNHQVNAAKQAI